MKKQYTIANQILRRSRSNTKSAAKSTI